MEQPAPDYSNNSAAVPRITQACDTDCRFHEVLPNLPDWGWCHDPACPFRQGLVRPGRECPRYAIRSMS